MRTLRLVWIVLTKELRDGMRDRRSILSVVISAALAPVLLGGMFTVMAGRGRDAEEIKLPVAGVEYAPAFIDWLKQQTGVEIVAAPADPEQAVRDRKEDVVLIVGKDFSKNMARAIPASVRLVSDSTRDSAKRKVDRARKLVTTYSGQLAALRLIARGVAPSVALPVQVEEVEVSSAQERLATLLNILPLLLVLAALTGGMQIAIDTTAGERERGSLEPLLLNPVSLWDLVFGKWLAICAFSLAGVVLTLLVALAVLYATPLNARMHASALLWMLVVAAPLVPLAAGIDLLICTFAQTPKEGNSYLGVVLLAPMLTGMLAEFFPVRLTAAVAAVPLLGQQRMLSALTRGEIPHIAWLALSAACAVVLGVAALLGTARLLRYEKVVFGR